MDVSVIIPCHDAGPYLAQAIGSALEQSAPPREIIVVDDGSTDDSLAVAHGFAARFGDRVRVLAHSAHNAPRTRNVGAAVASGEALLFLDADDVLAPDTLEALTRALRRQPGGIAVCPWFRLELAEGRWVQRPASCAPRAPGQQPLSAWLMGWYHPPCSVLWSRAAFELAGRWDEECRQNDDGDLMMRALARGTPFVRTSAGAGYYRRMPVGRASVSGERYSRRGLEDRLRVTLKVASWLRDRGRLDAYRFAISHSFEAVAADAGETHPDVRARAASLAGHHAPPRVAALRHRAARRCYRGARGAARYLRARARSGIRRIVHLPPPPPAEIRFGHRSAEEAASTGAQPLREDVDARPTLPGLSVIVTTGSGSEGLSASLASVGRQAVDELEIVVVGDGRDRSVEATVHEHGDPRVRYVSAPAAHTTAAARNHGIRATRGEFLAFLESGTEVPDRVLAEQVEQLRGRPGTVGLSQRDPSPFPGPATGPPVDHDTLAADLATMAVTLETSAVVIRRCVVAAVGYFDERPGVLADHDLWVRASRFFDVDCAVPVVMDGDRTGSGHVAADPAAVIRDRHLLRESP